MNTVERVKIICKQRKIPIYKLEKDLGFGNGYIGQLKKGVLPDTRLKKIAEYLGVSISYLLEGADDILDTPMGLSLFGDEKEKPAAQGDGLSDQDIRLVRWFRSLPPEKQQAILTAQDAPEGLV